MPKCVLVAEDEPLVLHTTVRVLTQHGYGVLQAKDGAEALNIAKTYDGKIDLLITNVRMPCMDGHELAREFKRVRPTAPVMIVSSLPEPAPEENSVYADALVKPVDPQVLIERVEDLLRQ